MTYSVVAGGADLRQLADGRRSFSGGRRGQCKSLTECLALFDTWKGRKKTGSRERNSPAALSRGSV